MRTISRPAAYTYLVLVAGVVLYGWFAPRPRLAVVASATPGGSDRLMFDAVVQRMQRGEPYYPAMRAELEAGNYPTASVFNWRAPLHLGLLSTLTITGGRLLLGGIAVAAVILLRAGPASPPLSLLSVGVPVIASTILVTMPEAWAGALIALSIGAFGRRQWTLAACCGVLAVFMRELAAIYAVVAGAIALWSKRRVESLVWLAGAGLFAIYYTRHVQAALSAMPPDAKAHGVSWLQWGGLPFVYRTVECYPWALVAPAIMAPVVVAAGLLGTAAREMPLHARAALIAYLAAFSIVGLPVNRYWGLVTVPLWGLGVRHAWSGLRRVVPAAASGSRDAPALISGSSVRDRSKGRDR